MPVKLLRNLPSDGAWITGMAWSPDGRRLAAGCGDNRVRVWDIESGKLTVLFGHSKVVSSVAWSPDGMRLASGSADTTVRIWNVDEQGEIARASAHSAYVRCVAWISDDLLASGGEDDRVFLWNRYGELRRYRTESAWVLSLAPSPAAADVVAAGCANGVIRLWRGSISYAEEKLQGHSRWVDSVAWTPDGQTLVSGSGDSTIRVWNPATQAEVGRLEIHTAQVRAVAISADGRLLASKADDETVALWDTRNWNMVHSFSDENGHEYWPPSVAFHPSLPILATPGGEIRMWEIDVDHLLGVAPSEESVKYVAAKIALVGDSGVGKTSLGFRLAKGEYQNHPSTHGQQFWVVDQLRTKRGDNTECEAVLWDFAGQPDYRLVHALFMSDVDLALILFDPTRPLEGVRYWLKQLGAKGARRPSMLVAARSDRGGSSLRQSELEGFCAQEGVTAGFVSTSALTGDGLDQLLDRIKAGIPWESMPATITTATFKRIKEHVLALKETRGTAFLVTPDELRQRLEESDPEWRFTDAEMMTAVKHLATHGYVSTLRASSGLEVILLAPELLAGVASSIVLEARRNPKGLGAVDEEFILHGGFQPREVEGLSPADRTLLVDAAAVLFLEHNICFRQTVGAQTFLIFPALINEKPPLLPDASAAVEYVSYRVTGAVENVYASLVVQLGYTGTFSRTNQWQNQAEYETPAGDVCGFRQTEEAEGEMELVLYHAAGKARAKGLFQELVEMFLRGRDIGVQKFEAIVCPNCDYRPQRAEIISRIKAGKDHLFCSNCGMRIPLAAAEGEAPAAHPAARGEVAVAARRTSFEAALVRIKTIVRDTNRKTPSCFISYAWGNTDEERWVRELASDLEHAGIEVVLDQKDQQIGDAVGRFIERIDTVDFVAVVGTPRYFVKYQNKIASTGTIVAAEVDLINQRLLSTEERKATVLPLLLEGDEQTALPPLMRGRVYADFRTQAAYFRVAFDLALTMYRIDRNAATVADVRETLARM